MYELLNLKTLFDERKLEILKMERRCRIFSGYLSDATLLAFILSILFT